MAEHRGDSTSTWLKVVDTDIGDKVVGGANWNTFLDNPYPKPLDHPVDASWWPEGGGEARAGENPQHAN